VIPGDGWEVQHRNALLHSSEPDWQPVAFFIAVAHANGINVVTLVLVDGQLTVSGGKLRRTV
jgi:hypothetical protein